MLQRTRVRTYQYGTDLPFAGATVSIYYSSRLHLRGSTDADGVLELELETGLTYEIRIYVVGSRISAPIPWTIEEVAEPEVLELNVPVEALTPYDHPDPRACVVHGVLNTVAGLPLQNSPIKIKPQELGTVVSAQGVVAAVLGGGEVQVRTDVLGRFSLPVLRGLRVLFHIAGLEDQVYTVTIPDSPEVELFDLLSPYTRTVSFSPPLPSTLSVGEESVHEILVTSSNGSAGNLNDYPLEFTSGDPTRLAVGMAGGFLSLRGVALGESYAGGVALPSRAGPLVSARVPASSWALTHVVEVV